MKFGEGQGQKEEGMLERGSAAARRTIWRRGQKIKKTVAGRLRLTWVDDSEWIKLSASILEG